MIVGLGTDIVDIRRVASVLERTGQGFIKRILHQDELSEDFPLSSDGFSPQLTRFVASRFAAKEAAAKALGTGFTQGVSFLDIRIISSPNGRPAVHFFERTALIAQDLQVTHTHISISHEKEYAVATVILESQ